MPTNCHVLESQGTTKKQAIVVCVFLVPLYASRAVYNLVAISNPTITTFGYSWVNVSDQADVHNAEFGYLTFGIILFVWEFLPTIVVVMFFRVKRPDHEMNVLSAAGVNTSYSSGAFFFDNPRRYDSNDDISVNSNAGSDDYPSILGNNLWRNGLSSEATRPPEGTPPVLYTGSGTLMNSRNTTQYYGDT